MTKSFVLKVVDPYNPKGSIEVIIPSDLIIRLYKYHPIRYKNFEAAKEVLENPERIFSGIRSINEGGLCYVGCPKEWYITENQKVPFPDNRVFAVYLNFANKLYTFRAEYADTEDRFSPKNWKDRFGGLVWKSTS